MLFNMTRVSKEADYFEVLGAVDEASSMIGIAREHCRAANNNLDEYLEKIQCCLLDVGSQAATPRNSSDLAHLERTTFAAGHVADLEHWTDKLDSTLPPLRNFILASGGLSATSLHAARAVTRRAERRMVPLANRGDVDDTVLKYLNRLSDFLFIAARFAAKHEGREELVYKKRSPGDHKRSLS
jgi:cob(I)alamin adenosyltransferase